MNWVPATLERCTILVPVALDISAIQRALADEQLDAWLLYDFQGSNPIAGSLTGVAASGKMTTRRWYYLIPVKGEPRALVHAIERHNLDGMPGSKTPYSGRLQLEQGLKELLAGCHRVAMEYRPIARSLMCRGWTLARLRRSGATGSK